MVSAARPRRAVVTLFVAFVCVAAATWAVTVHTPAGPRTARAFDADRLADLELGMWRAYYRRQDAALFCGLVVALREQFHYPWATSVRAAFFLARAAATFARSRDDYQRVLPDLAQAYSIARDWMGARFDPAEVARDELAWWVARRESSTRSPENVGRLIGTLYAHFYEVAPGRVTEAGRLRARAADLRDRGGANPDWSEVRRLLRASYRSLHDGVSGGPG